MYACIYELRKNCCGRVDGTGGESKVLQEVLADLKIFDSCWCNNPHVLPQGIDIGVSLGCWKMKGLHLTPEHWWVNKCMEESAKTDKLRRKIIFMTPVFPSFMWNISRRDSYLRNLGSVTIWSSQGLPSGRAGRNRSTPYVKSRDLTWWWWR